DRLARRATTPDFAEVKNGARLPTLWHRPDLGLLLRLAPQAAREQFAHGGTLEFFQRIQESRLLGHSRFGLTQHGSNRLLFVRIKGIRKLLFLEDGEMPVVSARRQVDGAAGIEEEQRINARFRPQQLRTVCTTREGS